jgi:CheY-like chemotaxis protein
MKTPPTENEGGWVTGTAKNAETKDGAYAGFGALGPAVLQLLLEKTPVVVWAVDRDLRLTTTAGAGLVAVGLRPGEGVGFSLYEYLSQKDESFAPIAAHLAALRGEASDLEHEWKGRLMSVRVMPIGPPDGPIEGALGVALDVTDQREAERLARQRDRDLREARKQEAIVRAVRPRVADLENIFSVLLAGTDRLATFSAQADIDQVRRSADRGVDVVRAMGEALASGAPDRDAKPEADRGGGETILLVDDEPQVRGFVRRALEDQGYRVLEAGTVEEALSIGAAFEGRIHLLLTDVVLPGQNGPHLAARLAPVRPEMRILYMTGYADDAIVDRGVLSAGQSLLVKPFTSLGLAHGVKKALRS